MKNPTYFTFIKNVRDRIKTLSKDELVIIILNLAEKQNVHDRNEFLKSLEVTRPLSSGSSENIILPVNAKDFML